MTLQSIIKALYLSHLRSKCYLAAVARVDLTWHLYQSSVGSVMGMSQVWPSEISVMSWQRCETLECKERHIWCKHITTCTTELRCAGTHRDSRFILLLLLLVCMLVNCDALIHFLWMLRGQSHSWTECENRQKKRKRARPPSGINMPRSQEGTCGSSRSSPRNKVQQKSFCNSRYQWYSLNFSTQGQEIISTYGTVDDHN